MEVGLVLTAYGRWASLAVADQPLEDRTAGRVGQGVEKIAGRGGHDEQTTQL